MDGRHVVRRMFCGSALAFFSIAAVASAQEIRDSPVGFDTQFQELFKTYQAGDEREFKSLVEEFRIPKGWFPKVFGGDQGQGLAKQYGDEFSEFEPHVVRNFQSIESWKAEKHIDASTPTRIDIQQWLRDVDPKEPTEAVPVSLIPLPRVYRFHLASFVLVKGSYRDSVSWMDSFIYVEGKFRFFGRGSSPFWKPAKVRRPDPCARPGQQTGGLLITRIEPIYPADALNNHIEGFVKAVLTVEKNGTVKNVEIIEGNPLLLDAAKDAFMQWQYTPFMNCGQPVEMGSFEHVKFSLSQ